MTNLNGVVAAAALVLFASAADAAPAGSAPASSAGHAAAPSATAPSGHSPAAGAQPQSRSEQPPPSQVSQDAPARSRMHECGHQWSSMKKAGTVGTMTWKEFSATCLVVSK